MQVRYICRMIKCSWEGIERVCKIARSMDKCDFIIAVGGGKAVDLGKGVATVGMKYYTVLTFRH